MCTVPFMRDNEMVSQVGLLRGSLLVFCVMDVVNVFMKCIEKCRVFCQYWPHTAPPSLLTTVMTVCKSSL